MGTGRIYLVNQTNYNSMQYMRDNIGFSLLFPLDWDVDVLWLSQLLLVRVGGLEGSIQHQSPISHKTTRELCSKNHVNTPCEFKYIR